MRRQKSEANIRSPTSTAQLPHVLLRAVKHTKNNHCMTVNLKKNFVRKATSESSAKFTMVKRKSFGIVFQSHEHVSEGDQKLLTQSRALLLVLTTGFLQIRPSLGTNGDSPLHGRDVRIWRSTSRQGLPGSPSRSNSANASSNACRSAAVGSSPVMRSASCNSARRANNCERSRGVSFGSSSKFPLYS
jgi:hypothetical protein